jgi:hypothetical protein
MRLSVAPVGRITPAGRLTEYRDGLDRRDLLEDLTPAAGRHWFIDLQGGTRRDGAALEPG